MWKRIQRLWRRHRGRRELRRTIKHMRKSLKQYGKAVQVTKL